MKPRNANTEKRGYVGSDMGNGAEAAREVKRFEIWGS